MNVVPAGVHHTDLLTEVVGAHRRCEGVGCVLRYRQSVHVGSNRDRVAGKPTAENAHDARVCHIDDDFVEAQSSEVLRHERGGHELTIAKFRILMDLVPELDDLPNETFDRGIDAGVLGSDGRG